MFAPKEGEEKIARAQLLLENWKLNDAKLSFVDVRNIFTELGIRELRGWETRKITQWFWSGWDDTRIWGSEKLRNNSNTIV